jgi:hypothetical protein
MPVKHGYEGARLLLADTKAHVYATYYRPAPELQGENLGCVYGRNRLYDLGPTPGGSSGGGGGIRPLALNGTIVGGENSSYSYNSLSPGEWWSVWSTDLRTGGTLRYGPSPGAVASIVVTTGGAIAWIAVGHTGVATDLHEEWLYAVDGNGERLLAHITGVAGGEQQLSALALGGSTVYWTQGGQPHAATLD